MNLINFLTKKIKNFTNFIEKNKNKNPKKLKKINSIKNLITNSNKFLTKINFLSENFSSNFFPSNINNNTEEFNINYENIFLETKKNLEKIFEIFFDEKDNTKTLIVHSDNCLKHCDFNNFDRITRIKKRSLIVENPDRLNVLFEPPFGIFLTNFFTKENILKKNSSKIGCLNDILKVHDFNYVMKIKEMCEINPNDIEEGNFIMKYGKLNK